MYCQISLEQVDEKLFLRPKNRYYAKSKGNPIFRYTDVKYPLRDSVTSTQLWVSNLCGGVLQRVATTVAILEDNSRYGEM